MSAMHSPHIIALCGWLVGWIMLWRIPRLERVTDDAPAPEDPDVSIIVPARNEATRLPRLLESMGKHVPEHVRVFVVDDHSEDDTAKIAASYPFVTVVPAPELPDGWMGKPWACHTGAQHAPPGVLVFMDADIWLEPGGLEHLLEAWRTHGGLVSVYPKHWMQRPFEHLSLYFQVVTMMGVRSCNLFAGRSATGAIGTTLVTSTEDYEKTGGFEAVPYNVIEDFAIAKLYREHGRTVQVYGGHDDLGSRLYPDGLRALCQGWIKTLALGANTIPILILAGIVVWVTCSLGSLTWVHGPFRWESGVLYSLFVVQMYAFGRQLGNYNLLTALAYPLLAVFFVALFAISVVQTFLTRKVKWRGRTIDVSKKG